MAASAEKKFRDLILKVLKPLSAGDLEEVCYNYDIKYDKHTAVQVAKELQQGLHVTNDRESLNNFKKELETLSKSLAQLVEEYVTEHFRPNDEQPPGDDQPETPDADTVRQDSDAGADTTANAASLTSHSTTGAGPQPGSSDMQRSSSEGNVVGGGAQNIRPILLVPRARSTPGMAEDSGLSHTQGASIGPPTPTPIQEEEGLAFDVNSAEPHDANNSRESCRQHSDIPDSGHCEHLQANNMTKQMGVQEEQSGVIPQAYRRFRNQNTFIAASDADASC